MSLSPTAAALEADLCLLTRLPLPTFDGIEGADAAAVSLDAVKERVFGSVEGPPRTERESVERYILAIVRAFDASGAESLDEFAESIENGKRIAIDRRKLGDLSDENKDLNRIVSQQDDAMQALRERYDALDEKCAAMHAERDEAIAERVRLKIALDSAQLATVAIERDEARSEVRRLQSIIDEQDTEHEDVSDDLRRVREEYDAVRHERDDLREACETMRQERDKAIRWHDKNVAERNAMRQERDDARAVLAKARERVERLQEINKQLETRNREATQAGASFGVETCGLLAEKDATIRDVRATFDDLFVKWEATCRERDAARREAAASHAELCALNAEIDRLRSDLASTRTAHAEITAAHAKLAADVAHKDRLMRDMNAALTHAREEAKTAHDALTVEQGRTERLRAVMVDLIADLNAAKEGAE